MKKMLTMLLLVVCVFLVSCTGEDETENSERSVLPDIVTVDCDFIEPETMSGSPLPSATD